MTDAAPRAPARLMEFFLAEAAGYVTTLREALWVKAADRDSAKFLAAAQGLRGAAAMARLTDLAFLAGRIERIARGIHLRRAQWTDPLSYSLQAVGYELPDLIAAAPRWSTGDSARVSAIVAALQPFDPTPISAQFDPVLPIARLFHDDGEPSVIYAAVTPQTQFEQQLREPAPVPAAATARAAPPPAVTAQPGMRSGQTRERPKRPPPPGDGPRATPARGKELRGLLARSLETFADLEQSMDSGQPAPIPIEGLLYTGQAALDRAREIREAHASAGTEPSGGDLDELTDLAALATRR